MEQMSLKSNLPAKKISNNKFYVVAIGSSAGGLNALTALLSSFPSEIKDFTIIIAQHLSPNYKSHLTDLLKRETAIPIEIVKNGYAMKSGRIYVTPPDFNITIKNGKFQLKKAETLHRPCIDLLFKSIAEIYKEKAIGIIFSGTGSDGSKGLKEIKKNGGHIIVQDPEKAKFPGMPESAIATKLVDIVANPSEIPDLVIGFIKTGNLYQSINFQAKESTVNKILVLLSEYCGTDFLNYKTTTVLRRIDRRMLYLRLPSMEDYFQHILENKNELDELNENLLISVTSFFRDKDPFKKLLKELEILLERKKKGEPVRIWIPGCATGEEAFSIAIIIYELLEGRIKEIPVQIFATDIDNEALKIARKGVYTVESVNGIDKKLLEKYFDKNGNSFEIKKFIRALILFSRHDITNSPPFLKLDVISCRNLLIYFNQKLQSKIIPTFHYALNPEGLLLLGKSETVGNYSNLFVPVDSKQKLYSKKAAIIQRKPATNIKSLRLNAKPPVIASVFNSVEDLLKERIYEQFGYPYAVINENMDIVRINGEVLPFLNILQGQITLNIFKNAHPKIQLELRSLLNRCVGEKIKVEGKIKRISLEKNDIYLRLKIYPLNKDEQNENFYLIVFESIQAEDFLTLPSLNAREAEVQQDGRILELENELRETKEHLQSFLEELETSNEELQTLNKELQSTNEEFQAANEELETSNEELQSANQEMIVAYNELRELNKLVEEKEAELRITSNKFQTLLENAEQAYILTDKDLNLVSFNQQAVKFTALITNKELKEGESIFNFIPSNLLSTFKENFDEAFAGKTTTKETSVKENNNEIWLRVQYAPVKGLNNQIENVMISYIDLSPEIKSQQLLKNSEKQYLDLIENLPAAVYTCDAEGRILIYNKAAGSLWGRKPELGKDLWCGSWKIYNPEGNELSLDSSPMALTIKEGQPFTGEEIIIKRPDETFRNVVPYPIPIFNSAGQLSGAINMLIDISERKEAEKQESELSLRLKAIFNGTNDAVLLTDNSKRYIQANRAAVRMLGYTMDELLLLSVHDIVDENSEDNTLDIWNRIKQDERESGIIKLKRKDGETIICRYNATANILPGLHLLILTDITEQKIAEDALRKSEEQYRQIVELANEGILMIDENHVTTFVNKKMGEILEYATEEMTGKKLFDFMDEEAKIVARKRMKAIKKGLSGNEEFKFRSKSGNYVWTYQAYAPVFDSDGNYKGSLIMVTDITERKIAKESLKQQNYELLKTNAELDRFVYSASHELRAPLMSILGLISIAKPEENDPAKMHILDMIQTSISRLDLFIKDIIIYSRNSRLKSENEKIEFNDLINESIENFYYMPESKKISFITEINGENNFYSDKKRIIVLLNNFISNAIKYHNLRQENPYIKITVNMNDEAANLEISDNGKGISELHIDKIFNMFYRATEEKSGSGLGLYIVKEILEKISGTVSVKSIEGIGTTFFISIKNGIYLTK